MANTTRAPILSLAGLLLACLTGLTGCGGPAYVLEDAESPVFLGNEELLTARRLGAEVTIRRVGTSGMTLTRSFSTNLGPSFRRFAFDAERGRILGWGLGDPSTGDAVAGFAPFVTPRLLLHVARARILGWMGETFLVDPEPNPDFKDNFLPLRRSDSLVDYAREFSLWTSQGAPIASRLTSPRADVSPDGDRVLRASPTAEFEVRRTAQRGGVVVKGPLKALGPLTPTATFRWPTINWDPLWFPPALSAGRLLSEGRIVYCWRGSARLYTPSEDGDRVETLGPGTLLAVHGERVFVLSHYHVIRAYDLRSARSGPLWEVRLSWPPRTAKVDGPWVDFRAWSLALSPDGAAIAIVGDESFGVVGTSQGRLLHEPAPLARPYESLIFPSEARNFALGNAHGAAFDHESHKLLVWAFGDPTPIFSHRYGRSVHLEGFALSSNGKWLAVSVDGPFLSGRVEVWNTE
ncbi:MAG: hypothetical protein JKY65_13675 [Planctomycetes bacterium]|nr:hypothetical protein [Planctomycetota bacterium]